LKPQPVKLLQFLNELLQEIRILRVLNLFIKAAKGIVKYLQDLVKVLLGITKCIDQDINDKFDKARRDKIKDADVISFLLESLY
jgi:hypothetical protein